MIDIGNCKIHTVHNAYCKGLSALSIDAEDFIIKIFYFFHNHPERSGDLSKTRQDSKIRDFKLEKYYCTRWLTLVSAASKALELLPALKKYLWFI